MGRGSADSLLLLGDKAAMIVAAVPEGWCRREAVWVIVTQARE